MSGTSFDIGNDEDGLGLGFRNGEGTDEDHWDPFRIDEEHAATVPGIGPMPSDYTPPNVRRQVPVPGAQYLNPVQWEGTTFADDCTNLPDIFTSLLHPVRYFYLFFTSEIFSLLARNTNSYANQKREEWLHEDPEFPESHHRPWYPVTPAELQIWIGINLYMAFLRYFHAFSSIYDTKYLGLPMCEAVRAHRKVFGKFLSTCPLHGFSKSVGFSRFTVPTLRKKNNGHDGTTNSNHLQCAYETPFRNASNQEHAVLLMKVCQNSQAGPTITSKLNGNLSNKAIRS